MTTQTILMETRETHGERLMRHSYRELADGDRLQASEKAWGAVDYTLRAVADRRGWEYETHTDAFCIIRRLVDELGDDKLRLLFSSANLLHRNHFIDAMPLEEIRRCIACAEELIEMLKDVLRG